MGRINSNFNAKNYIINGNFDIWQRGTSGFTSGYSADRWKVTQVTSAARSTDVPNLNSTYSILLTNTTANSNPQMEQFIESVNAKNINQSGKITVSFWAKCTGTDPLYVTLRKATTADTWGGGYTSLGDTLLASSPSGSWTKYTATVNCSSGMEKGTTVLIYRLGTANSTTFVSQVMLNEGSIAAPFQTCGSDFADEIAMCQRFYEKSYDLNTTPGTVTTSGAYYAYSNGGTAYLPFRQIKRSSTPTVTYYNPNSGASGTWRDINGIADRTTTTQTNSNSGVIPTISGTSGSTIMSGHWVADAEIT